MTMAATNSRLSPAAARWTSERCTVCACSKPRVFLRPPSFRARPVQKHTYLTEPSSPAFGTAPIPTAVRPTSMLDVWRESGAPANPRKAPAFLITPAELPARVRMFAPGCTRRGRRPPACWIPHGGAPPSHAHGPPHIQRRPYDSETALPPCCGPRSRRWDNSETAAPPSERAILLAWRMRPLRAASRPHSRHGGGNPPFISSVSANADSPESSWGVSHCTQTQTQKETCICCGLWHSGGFRSSSDVLRADPDIDGLGKRVFRSVSSQGRRKNISTLGAVHGRVPAALAAGIKFEWATTEVSWSSKHT